MEEVPEVIGRQGLTKWTNPTQREARFRLFTGVGRPPYKDIRIPPGESVLLPSEFDSAIQSTSADGVIQSGLGPQLKKDDKQYPMDPALDANRTAMLEAQKIADEARLAKAENEAALLRANALREKAESEMARQKAEADKEKAEAAARRRPGSGKE